MKLAKTPNYKIRYSKGFFEAYSLKQKRVTKRFKSYKELCFWASYWPSAEKLSKKEVVIPPMSFVLTITPEMINATSYQPKTQNELKKLVRKVKKDIQDGFLEITVVSNCLKMKNENANRS